MLYISERKLRNDGAWASILWGGSHLAC